MLVPAGDDTVTWTVFEPLGAVAVMDESEFTVTLVAGALPKLTAVTPVRFLPLIVTDVPPLPEFGLRPAIEGAG